MRSIFQINRFYPCQSSRVALVWQLKEVQQATSKDVLVEVEMGEDHTLGPSHVLRAIFLSYSYS